LEGNESLCPSSTDYNIIANKSKIFLPYVILFLLILQKSVYEEKLTFYFNGLRIAAVKI